MGDLPPWLKQATVWLLLATGVFVAVQAWQSHRRATRIDLAGGTLALRRAADGHYHWPGRIEGRQVDFLVDTGATGTSVPAALAGDLGLPAVGRMLSSTAGGDVRGTIVVGDVELEGGVRIQRLPMAALPALESPLLGMDVLGRLRWQQGDGVLRIDLGTTR